MKLYFASMYSVVITITIVLMVHIGKGESLKTKQLRNQLKTILVMDVLYFLSFFINDFRFLEVEYQLVLILEVITLSSLEL